MSPKRVYTKDSVRRALSHHELAGRITFYSPPGQGQPKWRVALYGQDRTLELTTPMAYVLVLGLAAAELHAEGSKS